MLITQIVGSTVISATGAGAKTGTGAPPVQGSSCAVSGTITSATENTIVAGGAILTLTLTGDEWVATVGADNQITTDLIAGIDSGQEEAAGWDAVVKAALTHAAVVRTNDTTVTITLPAYTGFAITANETVTVTVPASSLQYSTDPVVASPTVTITNVAETVTLSGTALLSLTPEEVVTGSKTIIFTVAGDQWVATLGADNQITTDFLAAIDSAQSEATGWDAEVKTNLDYTMLTRDSATQCTLILPASASYDITASETITASPPASSLLASSSPIVASPTITVSPPVLFSSDWSTLLGTSSTAILDGTTWPWGGGACPLEVKEVDGKFVAGFSNYLYVPLSTDASGTAFNNGALHWNITPTLAVGGHLYIRFYFRNDLDDALYNASHTYGGNHPNELEEAYPGVQDTNIGFKWDDSNGNGFAPILMTAKASSIRNFRADTRLDKATEYRWEVHVHRTSSTAMILESRIYNAAGTLILDNANFIADEDAGLSLADSPSLEGYSTGYGKFKVGNNGPSWTFPSPNTEYEAWGFGGVCIRSDTWCGPYAGGV